jgi:L-iditol 2-dehydrogenase
MYIGMGTSALLLPTGPSLIREVDVMGVFRYANTYSAALALLGSGQLPNVEKMITQRYPLIQAEDAFNDVARGKGINGEMVVKVMIGKKV